MHDDMPGEGQDALLRVMSLAVTAISIVCAGLISIPLGVGWDLYNLTFVSGVIAPWLLLAMLKLSRPTLTSLGLCALLLTVLVTTIFSCGAVAIMSTRSPVPLADALLQRLDGALGLSAEAFVTTVASGPQWVIDGLHLVYASTTPLTLLTLVALPLMGQARAALRFMLLFQLTLLCCALIAFLLPAYGAFTTIDLATTARLPDGAGRFFWAALTGFRSAADPVVSVESLGAVVSFPSFHTVVALLLVQAWHKVRLVNMAMLATSALIIVSTLPMGGHYFADVIAGTILWWGCSCLLRSVLRSRSMPLVPRRSTQLRLGLPWPSLSKTSSPA